MASRPADQPSSGPLASLPVASEGGRAATRRDLLTLVVDALDHLYDPVYLQTHPLARMLHARGRLTGPGLGQALRQELLEAIANFVAGGAGSVATTPRGHRLLTLRYVEALEPSQVQRELAIGHSQYYRELRRAMGAVVSLLEEKWGLGAVAEARSTLSGQSPVVQDQWPTSSEAPSPSRTSVPVALTSFVGRGRELEELRRLLPTTRLLTLTGTGGCGKTRLALQLATGLVDDYPDGIQVVELASLADPELVPQTIAVGLGVRLEPGRAIVDTLTKHLRSRHSLLVLDNCEHLLLACAQLVDRLLRDCPRLQVLVTSREALGIAGETQWRVPSLEAPPPAAWAAGVSVGEYEAVRLFCERARAVKTDFQLCAENEPGVAQICWRLDGIPLAIELAAALVRFLSPNQIARRLDDRFRILTGGSRVGFARHQTLRAAVDWGHDLLSPRERTLFRRLAVFAGGWTLEVAESVCSDDDLAASEVLGVLAELVDKSLVIVGEAAGEARYRFLETIRQYAWERLVEAEEVEGSRTRHRQWVVALGEQAYQGLLGKAHAPWLERLSVDHDNIRSALAHCLETDSEEAVRLAGAVWRFWRERGHVAEGRRWLDVALTRAEAPTAARARALNGAGVLAVEDGDFERGLPLFRASVELSRQIGEHIVICDALTNLGIFTFFFLGDREQSRRLLAEGLSEARQTGYRRGEGGALLFLGCLMGGAGDYMRAAEVIGTALSIGRQNGEPSMIGEALWHLGWLEVLRGDTTGAREALREARRIGVEIEDEQIAGMACLGLAAVEEAAGSFDQAKALLRESLRLFREVNNPAGRDSLRELGRLLIHEGRHERGLRLLAAGGGVRRDSMSWRIRIHHEAVGARWQASLDAAKAALGKGPFEAAWAEGEVMGLERAIAYALEAE